ncbi:MAG: non-specific serine/threonine protein kinase [Acidobacteriota bacterium]|jgi:non-specific serine/threonine protein kinase|nr:non-specific serine/threonine protein kinase [Acidobacteriota bacterium]
MSDNDRRFIGSARAKHGEWSPATLNVERLLASAGPTIAARGREYYAQKWRLRVQQLSAEEAVVRVRGNQQYTVEFMRDGDEVLVFCDCPYADYDEDVVCKHGVAAALFLRDHLKQSAPVPWEDVLSQAVRTSSSSAPKRAAEFLFFSLQARGNSWAIVPYTVASTFFPETARQDVFETARVVVEQKLSSQAGKVSPYESGGQRVYANVTHAQAALVKMLAASSLYYGNYSAGATLDLGALFALLKGGPLFVGTDKNPLKQPLEICTALAHLELELERAHEDGTLLRAVAVAGERVFPLQGRKMQVVSYKPLWLLSDETVFQLDAPPEGFALFQQNPEINIPGDEEQAFFEKHLPYLAERFPLRGEAVRWEELREVVPVPRLYLTEEGKELRVELRFGYGDYELSHSRNAPVQSIRRDAETGVLVRIARQPEREAEWWETLGTKTYGLKRASVNYGALRDPEVTLFQLRANTHPLDFLLRHVPQLAAAGCEIYGEEELKLARINRNRPTISFSVTSGIDWFDVQAVVQFGDVEVALAEVRRVVRKRERFVKLADGSIGEIPPEWIEQYRHLFALGEEMDKGLRLAHHHLTLLDQLLADDERARTDQEFKRRRARLRDFDGIKPQKLPKHFNGELRPYQKAGFDWLYFLREYKFGGCLADDMGTGKTILTLAFLQSLKERGLAKKASLLVVPRSLVFNWEREAARFTPRLCLLNHATPGRTEDISEFDDYDLVLTTYGLLRRDVEALMHYEFNYLILDEAQAIKNPLAETAKAVRLLRGAQRLTLTGTPVENNTLELWSQFAFLNPGLLGNAEYFREEFATPIERKGDEAAAQFLRKMVYPFILRRTKDQVAKDLPPRTERQMVCDMEPAQRKLYDERRDYYRALLLKLIEDEGINNARFRVLEGLLRLRQICNHPRLAVKTFRGGSAKLELLLETLETLRAEGHKALVFSQFVGMLKLVEAELKKRRIPFAYLDGQTRDRQERVDAFQNDPSLSFFLISLKAGGVGLNLTAADYVIHVDPWWNPAVEMQASDRTHRIGQQKPVFIYKLIVRDSVEEKILELQERKRRLVTQLIATERSFFKSLTAADVAALFS